MKNRIKYLVILLLGLTLFTSCYPIEDNTVHKIVYYVNGEQVDLEPSSYKNGEELILPIPSLEENEKFSGWFLNANYTGNTITSISATDKENKILFGKIDINDISYDNGDLATALNINNYTYQYDEADGTDTYTESYKYVNGTIANTYEDLYGDTYTDYLYEDNDVYKFVYEYDGTWYYTLEGDENFEEYASYMVIILPSELDASHFELTGDYYSAKEEYLQSEAYNLMGSYEQEVFTSLKVYLNNNVLDKISVTSSYTYEGENIEVTYTITFTAINNTTIKVPNAIYDIDIDDNTITIEDIYEMDLNETVTVSGTITGIYGNNFFLNDGTKGILVYCGSNSDYVTLIEEGANLTVTAKISKYNDIYQLQNITSIFTTDEEFEANSTLLSDVSQDNLENYANDLVNLKNVKVVSLPTSYELTGKDNSFKVSLNDVSVDVFISKYISTTAKTALFTYLKTLSIGDIINLDNLHVSKYTKYQLVCCNQTTFTDGFKGEVKQNGLTLSRETITAVLGTLKEEILGSVDVFATYNDGSKKQLTVSEYIVSGEFNENEKGNYILTFTNSDFKTQLTINIISKEDAMIVPTIDGAPLYEVLDTMGYDETTNTTYGITKGLPSTGTPKVLVIPIEFSDAPASSTMVSDLEKAFFGTSEETGWESLQSYYYKSSYGKLTIEGTVLQPYNTGKSTKDYDKLQKEYNKALDAYLDYESDTYPDNVEFSILKSALAYYDLEINYDDYDTDGDGYIDSIYLIYTRDYDTSDDSLWWAFTTEYYTEEEEKYDNVEADFYMFMSYQFIFDELQGHKVTYNSETIIHETGHLLGLDDYYDYDSTQGPNGGIGGGDMMDYNVGDHNAYSKLLLGWITPYITTATTVTLDLNSFEKSGECVMICKNWNGSFFTEFFIIDFFTPTGLNEIGKGSSGLFSISGIRIYHVDATLNSPSDCGSIFQLTKYDNSYTEHRLITLIEADGRNDIDKNGSSENSDLFQAGSMYTNAKWYDKTKANFTIQVNSITTSKANITISF